MECVGVFFGKGVEYCFVSLFLFFVVIVNLFYRMDCLYLFMPEAEPNRGPFSAFVVAIAVSS